MAFSEKSYQTIRNQYQTLIGQVKGKKIEKEDAEGDRGALIAQVDAARNELGLVANTEERGYLENLERLDKLLSLTIRESY